ncbi:unknown [Methanoculleus sp. CAG:1088]|nr:unknown [Methanoculleus sp. CAG:1088]
MSFLDNTKTAGTALWIVGILMIISALLTIICGVVDDEMNDHVIGWVILGIGSLICALVYFAFGKSVKSGEVSDKFDIVTKCVYVVGYTTIIGGVFAALCGFGFDDIGGYLVSGIISIVLGFVILWIHKKITDGNISTFDRIMWILLLVIFVICFISSFFGIGGSGLALAVNIIVAICDIVIYLFMIAFMLDNSVKAKFGM